MELFAVPDRGLDLPGWFGKLPGMGDFDQRRLPPRFRAIWDEWLQKGLQTLRAEREDWLAHYLQAPIWFFALGEGVMSPSPWIGVLMPSVDSVGRYFPLTVATELVRGHQASSELQMAGIHQWWLRSAKAALAALDANLDAAGFESLLHSASEESAKPDVPFTSMSALPAAGMSSWCVNAGAAHGVIETVANLPGIAGFGVLFGYASPTIANQGSQ